MKRLISATLALSLLGATAASAAPVSTPIQYREDGYRHRGDDNGAAIAAGVGFLALMAILASQHRDHDRWNDRDYDRDDWGHRDLDRYGGYDRGYGAYDRGYGYGNGGNDNGYGYRGR